jgi:hypothetical protein
MRKVLSILILTSLVLTGCFKFGFKKDKQKDLQNLTELWVEEILKPQLYPEQLRVLVKADTVYFENNASKKLTVHLSRLSQRHYYREEQINKIDSSALAFFNSNFGEVSEVDIRIRGNKLSYLVPNAYRNQIAVDSTRLQQMQWPDDRRVVRKETIDDTLISNGLKGRNLAMWQSHGWYYEQDDDRWKFQRARLFQTVEDLFPTRFVLNYLVPMLENAGAQVWLPRERGLHATEIIVDDQDFYSYSGKVAPEVIDEGFALGDTLIYGNTNPFEIGTSLKIDPAVHGNVNVQFNLIMPEAGTHPLYIAYPKLEDPSTEVKLTVQIDGFTQHYNVDQSRAFRTWVHIDNFYLSENQNLTVTLSTDSTNTKVWGWDAVRLGGGTGKVVRGGRTSGRPMYVEGSRYWLQYAGFPDSLVYDFRVEDRDYTDDYVSRGEWVNFLMGGPTGANENRSVPGLNVPIDLSLAFHTDAGTDTAGTIGTLLIYSTNGADGEEDTLYDGSHRITNRDLSDITQTEIVKRTRANWMDNWQRRGLWDRRYSEAFRPNVPAMLLELMSHHNEIDMRLGLDPNYRFEASRAIYIGMLKYLASRHGFEPIVQPLPVEELSLLQSSYRDSLILSWVPKVDSLELTATPNSYIVEVAESEAGNYQIIAKTDQTSLSLSKSELKAFNSLRVRAVNEGGSSMPSAVLGISIPEKQTKRVLLVDLFTRIEGPKRTYTGGRVLFDDEGMTQGVDPGLIGRVKSTLIADTWKGNSGHTNDAPGFGATASTWETMPIAGNTGFHMVQWAKDLKELSIEADVASRETFLKLGMSTFEKYDHVIFVAGAQRTSTHPIRKEQLRFKVLTLPFLEQLEKLQESGTSILLNGAYIGQAIQENSQDSVLFGRSSYLLGTRLITKDVSDLNLIRGGAADLGLDFDDYWSFTNKPNSYTYFVDDPDGIGVLGGKLADNEKNYVLLRTAENDVPVSIFRSIDDFKAITVSIPLELIEVKEKRIELIQKLLNQL